MTVLAQRHVLKRVAQCIEQQRVRATLPSQQYIVDQIIAAIVDEFHGDMALPMDFAERCKYLYDTPDSWDIITRKEPQ